MDKSKENNPQYYVYWPNHCKYVLKNICSQKEHGNFMDITIICGGNVTHVHRSILAANSVYFREHLETNDVKQIVVNGLDFSIVRAIVDFMYCGEASIATGQVKYFIAAAKLFQLEMLSDIFETANENFKSGEIVLPAPRFLCKSPKYSTTNQPLNLQSNNDFVMKQYQKNKQRSVGVEAGKACDIEAQGSNKSVLELVKSINKESQGFTVEENFVHTTVENLVPYEDRTNGLDDGNNENGIVQLNAGGDNEAISPKTGEKMFNENIEILFQTNDGKIVNFPNEIRNFPKGTYQFQIMDENGQLGEPQDLQVFDMETMRKIQTQLNENSESGVTQICLTNDIKIARTVPDEYIDPKFAVVDVNLKKMLSFESTNTAGSDHFEFIMRTPFEDQLYDNRMVKTYPDMGVAENLTIRATNAEGDPFTLAVKSAENDDNNQLMDLTCEEQSMENADIIRIKEQEDEVCTMEEVETDEMAHKDASDANKIIFTPEMFLYDLTEESAEDKIKNGSEGK